MNVMDAQEGGVNCASKINAQIKRHKSYTGSVYLTYVQSSTTQAESSTISQVLNRVHLKPYNRKFCTGSLATLQQVLHRLTCNLSN